MTQSAPWAGPSCTCLPEGVKHKGLLLTREIEQGLQRFSYYKVLVSVRTVIPLEKQANEKWSAIETHITGRYSSLHSVVP